jgi:RNA polymerase sigma-70 factor (ECF subfamily)
MTPAPPIANGPTGDDLLVTAVQAGDIHSFDLLVERHLDAVHAFVALKLPVAHLVDEITHEAFVFAFRRIAEFTPGTSFRAWLRAIAANKIRAETERFAREERNRLAYAEQRALDEALAEPAGPPDSRELDALQDCLHAIPGHSRQLLDLRYREEHPSEQIASRLGRSLAWVRTTLCRLRQQLRDCIERKLKALPS